MPYWKIGSFWLHFGLYLVPATFVFGLAGALFIDQGTPGWCAALILISQCLLTFAVPWALARRVVRMAASELRGFPVVMQARTASDDPAVQAE